MKSQDWGWKVTGEYWRVVGSWLVSGLSMMGYDGIDGFEHDGIRGGASPRVQRGSLVCLQYNRRRVANRWLGSDQIMAGRVWGWVG